MPPGPDSQPRDSGGDGAPDSLRRDECHAGAPARAEILALKVRAREATALFMNAQPEDVALAQSATALTFRLAAAFARLWGEGDEVILSGLEHESNASPWRNWSGRA